MPTLSANSKAAVNALAQAMQSVVSTLKNKGYNLPPNGLYDLSQFKPEHFFNPPFDYRNPSSLASTQYPYVAAMAAYNTVMTLKKLADSDAGYIEFAKALTNLRIYRKLINQGVKQSGQDVICSGVIYIVDGLTLQLAIHLSRFSAMASLDENLQDTNVKTFYNVDSNFALRQEQLLVQFNNYAGLQNHLNAIQNRYIVTIGELTKNIIKIKADIAALKDKENISFVDIQKYQAELSELLDKNLALIQDLNEYVESIKHLENHVNSYEDHFIQLKRIKEETLQKVHIQLIKEADSDLAELMKKAADVNAPLEQLKKQRELLLEENLTPQDYAERLKTLAKAAENHAQQCRFAAGDIGHYCGQLQDEIASLDQQILDQQPTVVLKPTVEVVISKPWYHRFLPSVFVAEPKAQPKIDPPQTNVVIPEVKKITDKKIVIEEKLTVARAQYQTFHAAADQGSAFAATAKKLAHQIEKQTIAIDALQRQIINLEFQLNTYIQKCDSLREKFVHLFKSEVLDKKKQAAHKLRVSISEPTVNLVDQFEVLRKQKPENQEKANERRELLTRFSQKLNDQLQGYAKILTDAGVGKKSKLKKIIADHQQELAQTTKKLKK